MHASLAYIGRACTVDDDEPPETPTYNSLDSQSGGAREKYPQADTGLALRELVDKSLPLSASIGMVTLLNKVAHLCQEPHRRNGEEPTFLCQHTRCSDELSGTDQTAHLIQPTRLHRLCELISGAVRLDVLDGVTNEIGSGLFDLTRHAEITALEQYKNFEQCIRALFYNPNLSAFPTTNQRIRCTQGCHSASPFPHTPSISNQLGELRVLCESIRQCLSQVTQFTHEKHTICHFTDRMAHGSMRSVYDSELDTLPHYFNVKLNSLICTSLLAAHHLAYSGLCTIAHIELTCFTHGELWEMLRGVEELDILSNSVHTMRQTSRTLSVVQNLFQAVAYPSSSSLIEQLMIHQNLFWDPILSVSSVSLGYLFVLLAHHRSFRLSYAIYCELLSISNYSDPPEAGLKDKLLDDPKPKHTLLEEFRRYLNEHYHRTDPDYLRAEYDFIANFLDVLSQSTNLLHQVQTLKAVCTTGTGAQAKRTEILRETQLPTASATTVLEPDMPHSFRALSVEGKHGILLRRDSGDRASGSAHFSQRVRSSQDRRNFILQFQDTLHRACTFDRYVATGSVLCSPVNSDSLTSKYPATVVPTGTPGAQISAGQHSSKKSVQWSDHREVSIRHQVISRFLEMIWHHTETLLNDLVLCPPASSVAACQVCDLPPCRQTDHDLNAPLYPPKVNARFVTCLTLSSGGLQQLSRRIKEVAKADIFPIGLAPAIGRQALILEHLAHRRCCYADMVKHKHRLLNLAAVNLPPATSSERPQYLKPESPISQRVACHSDCESTWNFPKPFFLSECCVSLRDIACASATSNVIQQWLSAASPMSLDPQNEFPHFLPILQSREFCTSFIPLLQLTFTCARALGNCVPGGLHHQVTHIEKQLRVIGMDLPPNHLNLPHTSTQNLDTIQLTYEANRRIGRIHNLLRHQMSLLTRQNQCHCMLDLNRLKDGSGQELNHIGFPAIRLALQLVILFTAEVFQIYTLIHSVLQLTGALIDGLRQNFAGTPSGTMSYCSSYPQPLSSVLSDGIRAAAAIARISKLSHWLSEFQDEVLLSYTEVRAQFASICRDLNIQYWSHSLSSLPKHPLDSKLLDDFLTMLQTTLPDGCSPVNRESTPSESDNPSSCHFHHTIYTSFLNYVFHIFCRNWIKALVSSDELSLSSLDDCSLLRHHAASVKNLRSALFNRQTSMPISLLTALSECHGFCQLQASVPAPYEMLAGLRPPASMSDYSDKHISGPEGLFSSQVRQQQYPPPDLPTATSQRDSSRPQRSKGKWASRFNVPGGALSALASGVKTNLLTSLKGLTGIEGASRRIIPSDLSGSTLLKPFRSRCSSHERSK